MVVLKQFDHTTRSQKDDRIVYPDDKFDVNGNLVFDGMNLWEGATHKNGVVFGVYTGDLVLDTYTVPDRYRTSITGYDLLVLMGMLDYAAVTAGASAGDPVAVYFIKMAEQLGAAGKSIVVNHPDYMLAMASFLSSGYIDQAKHDEMLLGVLI